MLQLDIEFHFHDVLCIALSFDKMLLRKGRRADTNTRIDILLETCVGRNLRFLSSCRWRANKEIQDFVFLMAGFASRIEYLWVRNKSWVLVKHFKFIR